MVGAAPLHPGRLAETADQRVVLHDVPWSHLEVMLALRGDAPAPRLTYLRGELELMSPSRGHEHVKSLLGRLIEAYAEENDLSLNALGSWTLKSPAQARAAEPDECYVLGDPTAKERPDLAIEVVWTHGGIDKLQTYAGLEVPEVWLWTEAALTVYVRGVDGYEPAARSRLLPDLDLDLVRTLLDDDDQTRAVRSFRRRLRGE